MADGRIAAIPDPTSGGQAPADPALLDQIKDETARAQAITRANDPEDGGRGINPITVQAKLRSTQAATTAAIGAGFEFTPEEVELQLKHCNQQLVELRNDLMTTKDTLEIKLDPADDDASRMQAYAVKSMLASTVNVINADIAYLMSWQNKLNIAKQNYMTTEQLNEQQWAMLSQGLQA
jgi:hypothetical protein